MYEQGNGIEAFQSTYLPHHDIFLLLGLFGDLCEGDWM